jgi:hypothetical protein
MSARARRSAASRFRRWVAAVASASASPAARSSRRSALSRRVVKNSDRGLDRALSAGLARWRKPNAVHDPAKVLTDLAIALALGGDCLADVALLRAEPGLFGPVASDPTVSRALDLLAVDATAALATIDTARAAARARVWALAGRHAPDAATSAATPLVIDLDATLVTAHSDKEQAAPTFKRGYGFHPLWSFVDHGAPGSGEPLAVLLRPGNAGSDTAADHITVTRAALRQLPGHRASSRPGRKVLIRADAAGATHGFLSWLAGQRLSYSVGFTLPTDFTGALTTIPAHVWAPAYDGDGDGRVRDGGPGRRGDRAAGPDRPADRDAGDRAEGTPAPRRAAAAHRRRRTPDHRVRHQHRPRAAGRPGAAAPPPGPLRGPDPRREGHRPAQPAAARLRAEPDLVRHRRAGLRPHHLEADAGPTRPARPPPGTHTAPAPAAVDRRPPRRLRPPHRAAPAAPRPGPTWSPRRSPPCDCCRRRADIPDPRLCEPAVPPRTGNGVTGNDTRRTVTPPGHDHPHSRRYAAGQASSKDT